ncbi:MAG: ParB N-terminal domain-containing protein [Herpetosiphonaceae bacterium]|nr:ParB N-terminal domain-containing protein [Herpetosiphonaceae bacterium]
MSDIFKQRMRNLGGTARPTSAATIVDQAAGKEIVVLPVGAIAPDPLQVRFLPRPEELLAAADGGDADAKIMLSELRALGQSLAEQQIHPLLVYPIIEVDPEYPQAEWRILSGERRWRAAVLTNLPTLQAIQLPKRPNDAERLIFQYVENEARASLSDLDRAEAAQRLKDQLTQEAGKEVPWAEVETRLNLSESRRIQLMRLYDRLPVETRPLVRAYRWPERTLRPLHSAVFNGTLQPDQAVQLLDDLRARTQRGDEISGTLVGKLVADIERQGYQGEAWLDEERERVQRMINQGKQLLKRDLSQLSSEGQAALRRDVQLLQRVIKDVEQAIG